MGGITESRPSVTNKNSERIEDLHKHWEPPSITMTTITHDDDMIIRLRGWLLITMMISDDEDEKLNDNKK